MTEPAPQPLAYDTGAYLNARDIGHLRTLSICHYVWGGLTAFLSCMFLIHIGMGVAMVSGRLPSSSAANQPPAWFGLFFIALGAFALLFGWAIAAMAIYSGYCLRVRRHWLFSNIIAGVACLWVPLGTILGVFTIVILQRDSVKALYGKLSIPAPPMLPMSTPPIPNE